MFVSKVSRDNAALRELSYRARCHVVQMAGRGGCFLGSALSCVDALAYLHSEVLRSPLSADDPHRDWFILSKGHAVPALYAVLAELGRLEPKRLESHLSGDDHIYWHPDPQVPGVDFRTGSLGHGPAVACGIALDQRLRGSRGRVYCMVGDGELNEGSVWETLLVASAKKLEQLVLIVDRNGFQANFPTEQLAPLEPLVGKLEAFGCVVERASGHDFTELARAFSAVSGERGKPAVVVLETTRGKGIPRIEGDWEQWFVELDEAGTASALKELEQAR